MSSSQHVDTVSRTIKTYLLWQLWRQIIQLLDYILSMTPEHQPLHVLRNNEIFVMIRKKTGFSETATFYEAGHRAPLKRPKLEIDQRLAVARGRWVALGNVITTRPSASCSLINWTESPDKRTGFCKNTKVNISGASSVTSNGDLWSGAPRTSYPILPSCCHKYYWCSGLGHHWFKQWLVACSHWAIAWINAYLLATGPFEQLSRIFQSKCKKIPQRKCIWKYRLQCVSQYLQASVGF